MAVKININKILKRAARKIEARIRLQAPEGKTGNLKRSISVKVERGEIVLTYADYGKFTNYGTEQYRVDEVDEFEGYVKGTDGIRAQEWSAVPESTIQEIIDNIEKEIEKEMEKASDDVNNFLEFDVI